MVDGPRYTLAVVAPATHLLEVTADLPANHAAGGELELALPAWSPGSYLIRDYARLLRDLRATAGDTPLPVVKRDKSTWAVAVPAGAERVTVRYAVYGHDLTVRTNHVDATHAFVHGPATFLYAPSLRDAPVRLEVRAPEGWGVATSLPADGDGFRAASIDELFDSPLHLGLHEVRRFTAAGVPFSLVTWGDRAPGGPYSLDTLVADLAAIADDHAARLGSTPFGSYLFLLMLSHDAYGGLEHRASSANLHNPRAFGSRREYHGLLELLSHELFHAWNGKRIAPPQLLAFDYQREAHTRCLWVMEGLTSHYDRWALRTAGRLTGRQYLEKVLDDWTRLLAVPGRRRQSLEESSFDAWIKLYKPDESNLNTTVSYYLKGGLVAQALDLEIRRRTDGARSLDDVLRALWQRHGAEGLGHPEDVQPLFEEATGLALEDTFTRTIRGVDDPALADELAHVGVTLRPGKDAAEAGPTAWLGVTTTGARITGVLDDAPAAGALSPGDEVLALDGFRATTEADLRALLAMRRPGERIAVTLFRRNRLVTVELAAGTPPPASWELAGVESCGPEAAARYEAWLGEPHPGPVVLATVACGGRWL